MSRRALAPGQLGRRSPGANAHRLAKTFEINHAANSRNASQPGLVLTNPPARFGCSPHGRSRKVRVRPARPNTHDLSVASRDPLPREATPRSVPKLAANLATRVKLVRRAVASHRTAVGGRGHRRLIRVPAIRSRIGLRRRGNGMIFMPHRSRGRGRSRAAWSGTNRSTRSHAATATAAGLRCFDATKTQSAGQHTNRQKFQHDQFPSRKNVGIERSQSGRTTRHPQPPASRFLRHTPHASDHASNALTRIHGVSHQPQQPDSLRERTSHRQADCQQQHNRGEVRRLGPSA